MKSLIFADFFISHKKTTNFPILFSTECFCNSIQRKEHCFFVRFECFKSRFDTKVVTEFFVSLGSPVKWFVSFEHEPLWNRIEQVVSSELGMKT